MASTTVSQIDRTQTSPAMSAPMLHYSSIPPKSLHHAQAQQIVSSQLQPQSIQYPARAPPVPHRKPPSLVPTVASRKEPGVRVCPHECANHLDLCDRTHVYGKAGNSCRRHASTATKHPECNRFCPAHQSRSDRVLERELTYSEWKALSQAERSLFKGKYRAKTPRVETLEDVSDSDEDMEEEEEQQQSEPEDDDEQEEQQQQQEPEPEDVEVSLIHLFFRPFVF